jgi:diacylglycerol kinase
MRKFIKGFGYAFSGIYYAFKTQLNFRVHGFFLLFVILLGWYLKISANEWLCIFLVSGIVFAAELFNTGIEVLVDLVSPEIHPKAKIIKDVSAAAVLITAITAVVVGLIIFVPKILAHAA